jgi:hypothetical protein
VEINHYLFLAFKNSILIESEFLRVGLDKENLSQYPLSYDFSGKLVFFFF